MENAKSLCRRTWPALVSFLLPILFTLVVMQGTVRHMLPEASEWVKVTADNISAAEYDRFTRDIEARLLYGVISAFGLLAAAASATLAGFVLVRLFGRLYGPSALLAAIVFGVSVSRGNTDQDLIRGLVLDDTIKVAQQAKGIIPGALDKLYDMINLNMGVGLAATAALLAGFAAVAMRAAPEDFQDDQDGAGRLRERVSFLTYLTLSGAAILVLLVAVNKVLLGWPQGVLTLGAAKSYGVISTALANYWGAIGTGVLLCALVPALISVKADIAKAAGARRADYPTQEKWRKESGLEIAPASAVIAALTTAAPLFTGPAIDILSALLKG
jgi:hypothetical protein